MGRAARGAIHVMIEAKKLAYADMIRRVGDPAFSKIPVTQLLSKEYAIKQADLISPDKASCGVLPAEYAGLTRLANSDTIYLTAVDHAGNQVSFIQSNFGLFGSGVSSLQEPVLSYRTGPGCSRWNPGSPTNSCRTNGPCTRWCRDS